MSSLKTTPHIVVTGASSGIGRAIVYRLLRDNCHVIGIARNFSCRAIDHEQFTAVEMDLSNIEALPEKVTLLAKANSNVHAIVFCAGRGQFGSIEEFSYAQIQEMINLNFLSQAYLAKAFMPMMKKRKTGKLIFIGSESALKGERKGAIYCASKFALRGMAHALRDECSKSGVSVSIVNPGMVKTPFFDALGFEPGDNSDNYLVSDDVANAVSWVLSMHASVVVDEINLSPLKKVVQHKPKQSLT
ncbi:MAG: SDR family oxidoreductase [Gammaproteobacteria bacterium]|nr:SDR family oxidoreductase [Gammaproteobacteria bacterium]